MAGTTRFRRDLAPTAELTARGISLRGETEEDFPFLEHLFASVRWQDLEVTGWPKEAKLAFLQQQFALQVLHYAAHYADTDFGVVVHDGEPIGRLYLYRTPRELRIVDISLAPEWRGQGIGSALLEAVFAEAAATGVKVTIHVEQMNPARGLYRRLGFREKALNGPYWLMDREPHPSERTCPK